jgi:alkylated DNA repair dioxygenase AlkB
MAEPVGKINIIQPVNPERVHIEKDPFHPTALVVSLPLDSEPSYVWLTLFEQVLWSSLDFWDRKVVIVGKEL